MAPSVNPDMVYPFRLQNSFRKIDNDLDIWMDHFDDFRFIAKYIVVRITKALEK